MAADTSSARRAFAEHVVDLLRGLGPVQARAMFGGHGLYLDGLMFALLADARFFVKVDAETRPAFEAERCLPFVFEAKGRRVALSYHEAPLEALDQPEVAVRWARLGVAAAMRGAELKARKAIKGHSGGQSAKRKPSAAMRDAAAPAEPALADLPNLGPRSAVMLGQAGICTLAQLQALGSVQAFLRTKAQCPSASLNLLWALEGALSGRPWHQVAEQDRLSLLMALEDAQSQRR